MDELNSSSKAFKGSWVRYFENSYIIGVIEDLEIVILLMLLNCAYDFVSQEIRAAEDPDYPSPATTPYNSSNQTADYKMLIMTKKYGIEFYVR